MLRRHFRSQLSDYPKSLSLNSAFPGLSGLHPAGGNRRRGCLPHAGSLRTCAVAMGLHMHSLARNGSNLVIASAGVALSVPVQGEGRFSPGQWQGCLAETGHPIVQRLSYDESHIASRCEVSGSIIRTTGTPLHSAAEVLIAVTKILHQKLYPLVDRKWIVSRIELQRVFTDTDFAMEVELLQNLNHRLTRSAVRCASESLGHIYFSAIKP